MRCALTTQLRVGLERMEGWFHQCLLCRELLRHLWWQCSLGCNLGLRIMDFIKEVRPLDLEVA